MNTVLVFSLSLFVFAFSMGAANAEGESRSKKIDSRTYECKILDSALQPVKLLLEASLYESKSTGRQTIFWSFSDAFVEGSGPAFPLKESFAKAILKNKPAPSMFPSQLLTGTADELKGRDSTIASSLSFTSSAPASKLTKLPSFAETVANYGSSSGAFDANAIPTQGNGHVLFLDVRQSHTVRFSSVEKGGKILNFSVDFQLSKDVTGYYYEPGGHYVGVPTADLPFETLKTGDPILSISGQCI